MRYTVLVASDDGGGSAVIPGPTSSSLASIDFASMVMIARAKRDVGLSFVSLMATDREHASGEGHNRVVGPDFRWRPNAADVVTGQWLISQTRTPVHPDLAAEWTGQTLSGRALAAQWNHATTHLDVFAQYHDLSDGFRADTGFVPQVGYRQVYGFAGWTVRPANFFSNVRPFLTLDRQVDQAGTLISREVQPGIGMNSKANGVLQFGLYDDRVRTPAGRPINRRQFGYFFRFSPSPLFAQLQADGRLGEEIDFDNSRPGRGPTIDFSATLRPTQHLELALIRNQQWLNVDDATGQSRRLFAARVSRIRSMYTFTSRLFVRAIAQYVSTDRDPSLYLEPIAATSGDFSASVLFAYKVNWQSVLYIGYGDDRSLIPEPSSPGQARVERRLAPLDRQVFVKLSYAFQR
jgi:hypothetical protein